MNQENRRRIILAALAIAALAVVAAAPTIGVQALPLRAVFGGAQGDVASGIFWRIRVPRVLTSFLVGAGLALSGMAFQAMFRNVLATPFTLGVAGGASFGAAFCLRAGIAASVLGIPALTLGAFAGAGIAILLVYGLTRLRPGMPPSSLLLAGVAVSFFFSSLILFIQYTSGFTHSFRIVRWLMGSIDVTGYDEVLNIAPFVALGAVIVMSLSRALNLMMLGDELSLSRGLDVERARKILFFAVSIMVGGIVSVCGPIGFVGMMAPHIMRITMGADHRYLAPASILFGGVFLTLCDTLARTVIAPAEIPVGVITALFGAPFFIWVLVGRSFSEWWEMR
jgi:iron complex transport system permease protein